jgi:hypothetical protein
VTFGAARIGKHAGVLRIPLGNQAVLLPRGKRLVVTVGNESANGVYRQGKNPPFPVGDNSITIRRVTLNLSVLKKAVSR